MKDLRVKDKQRLTHGAVSSPVILNLFSGDEQSRFLNGSEAPHRPLF